MITAIDASTGRQITGKLIKRYEHGITIDDAREIRYYVTLDRIVDGLALKPTPTEPGNNGQLFQ